MDDEFDTGGRLKALRQAAGLSQRQLAERAGVPHGQISMIETGRSSPSVASLRRILGGLGTSMSAFFEPDAPPETRVFFRADDLTDLTGRLGTGVAIAQVGDAMAHGLQILTETYAPGADTGEAMLDHEAHEGGVVISGEVEVTAEHLAGLAPIDDVRGSGAYRLEAVAEMIGRMLREAGHG